MVRWCWVNFQCRVYKYTNMTKKENNDPLPDNWRLLLGEGFGWRMGVEALAKPWTN